MDTNMLDQIKAALQGENLNQISREVGANEGATATAITAALPVILAGLARNAGTPDGAQSLNKALDEDHDGSLLDNIASMLGGNRDTATTARATNGGGILGHIFGNKREPVEQSVGAASGLNAQQAGKLLVMVAPLVMAYLGKRKRQQNQNDIGSVLQHEQTEIERTNPGLGGILGQVLGAGGQGNAGGLGGVLGGILRG